MKRKGLGLGTGKGYRNLIPFDRPVHQMSSKGIKQPQRLSLFAGKCGGKKQPLGDVWKLETPVQDAAIQDLQFIVDSAMNGNRASQNYLRTLWDGEKWESIKEKINTEDSVWYVWWMDGVNQHILKNKKLFQPFMRGGGKIVTKNSGWTVKTWKDLRALKESKHHLSNAEIMGVCIAIARQERKGGYKGFDSDAEADQMYGYVTQEED